MPYFKWTGVDITGKNKSGKCIAQSIQELTERLLSQGIALLRCKSCYLFAFLWPVTAKVKADLFKQQAQLLQAGMLLPNVLHMTAHYFYNPVVCESLLNISKEVRNGILLNEVLKKHSFLYDPIVQIMLVAGYESNNILGAVENISSYFYKQYIFNKNIRSILMMPLLTFLFFIGISFFIFAVIIPRFSDMFLSLQQELPSLTQSMIGISNFIMSSSILYTGVAIIVIFFSLYYLFKKQSKNKLNKMISQLPFIGSILVNHEIEQVFQALSLLVNNGIHIALALRIVNEAIENFSIQPVLISLQNDVTSGKLLSVAMVDSSVFFPEIIALIGIGEESSTLEQALKSASLLYNDRTEESLKKFVFFLQPLVIILLGCLITTLIVAVYLPIMQLSYIL